MEMNLEISILLGKNAQSIYLYRFNSNILSFLKVVGQTCISEIKNLKKVTQTLQPELRFIIKINQFI